MWGFFITVLFINFFYFSGHSETAQETKVVTGVVSTPAWEGSGASPAPSPVRPSVPGPARRPAKAAERVQKTASASSACGLGAFHAL